jgi:starch phosphorylase
MSGTEFSIEIQAKVPDALDGLRELADDLAYSWSRLIRSLFYRLDADLWENCGHNPKVFLRRIAQERLEHAVNDPLFMEDYKLALTWHRDYRKGQLKSTVQTQLDPSRDLIAYFSAEFGFHESLPTYSGGLGILAGDHCKAASDLGIPFVAVGLLYHQGYFTQTIDSQGHQIASYQTHEFEDLPIEPVLNDDGSLLTVRVKIAHHGVDLRIWRTAAGNITLYLLDSDVPSNNEDDRSITYRLYGGDRNTRIRQEIILGIGGVRALRALGLKPNAWHINEGHSAFQILERMREYIHNNNSNWETALEQVASNTVFTTHTPVAAGHDIFEPDLIQHCLSEHLQELNMDIDAFLKLGHSNNNHSSFNMTAFALRGSRLHNGVSRIHGSIASKMESYVWPEIPPEENPITYITNGIHVPTFLAREWVNMFDSRYSNWHNELCNPEFWDCLDEIQDYRYWSIHQSIRAEMLKYVHELVLTRLRRNDHSEATIRKATLYLRQPDSDILVVGFARRFATYKRATLLFNDEERLRKLLNNPERPVLMIFAGKAHPLDEPGQSLIEAIHHYSLHPDYIGKIILLEGYDIALSRKLISGVDVWLNTPEYPLEACGTSGQKAGINGVLNLSVLDGWWGEGYNGKNGWAIVPHDSRNSQTRFQDEATDLMDILEKQVIPTYYDRKNTSYSEQWIKMCKEAMKSILPQFNSERMVIDYTRKMYAPAIAQHNKMKLPDNTLAEQLARWKEKVINAWQDVSITMPTDMPKKIAYQESLDLQLNVALGKLSARDIRIELLLGERPANYDEFSAKESHLFTPEDPGATGKTPFKLSIKMDSHGLKNFKIRMYPFHELLTHRFEVGLMKWL